MRSREADFEASMVTLAWKQGPSDSVWAFILPTRPGLGVSEDAWVGRLAWLGRGKAGKLATAGPSRHPSWKRMVDIFGISEA